MLILSAEDDAADTVVPRLRAAGADLSQCVVVNAIVRTEGAARVLNLADDLGKLGSLIDAQRRERRNVRLVIVDPISAYMGGKAKGDTFKNSEVRALLTPLVEWAARYRVAVIAVSHFNKAGNGRALYRVTDSLAFTAAARTVWLIAPEEGTGRNMLLKGKNNIAADPGGLAYRIEGVDIGNGIFAPRIVWDGRVDLTAEEAFGQEARSRPSAADAAEECLLALLLDGPMAQSEIRERATNAGHSWNAVREAKSQLGVVSKPYKKGGPWYWSLPEDNTESDAA